MENMENDELEMDGLKLPSDAEEDYDEEGGGDSDESGPGLDDYGDEENFGEGIADDYGGEDGGSQSEQSEGEQEDGEAELEQVFAQANAN